MWKGIAVGIVNSGLALAVGATIPSRNVLLGVAVIGLLGYGVSLMLFVQALRHLGTARTGAYFSTAPFTGAALAFALGDGRLDWRVLAGGLLYAARCLATHFRTP